MNAENSGVGAVVSSPTLTRTILIVDDDPSVTETFERMLRLEGYNVVTALSAEAGLSQAERASPHAIILDLRMPSSRATTSSIRPSRTSCASLAPICGSNRCGSKTFWPSRAIC
jgi:response regulator RpfG family c-di-GMP phosphodiesterase